MCSVRYVASTHRAAVTLSFCVEFAAKDVQVQSEVHIRSCIVLSHKSLGRSFAGEVLL